MVILDGQRKGVEFVCLSHDETLVASASQGAREAFVWDLSEERVVQRCAADSRVLGIAFSGEGDVLRGTGDYPKWTFAWSVADGRFARHPPSDHEMDTMCRGRPLDVRRFGAGEKQRLVVNGDGWDVGLVRFGMERGERRRVGPGWVAGPHVDTGSPDKVVVRPAGPDDPAETPLAPLPGDVGRCWEVAVSDDRRFVALGFDGGLVYVHDVVDDTEVARWNWGIGAVRAIGFSPSGHSIVAGAPNGIAVWDLVPQRDPDPVERDLLAAIADGEATAVGVHSDYLEERGLSRWDRYDWPGIDPLRMHAEAVLRST